MSTNTLRNLAPGVAEGVLSRIADGLLPNPSLGNRVNKDSEEIQLDELVAKEIRQYLKIAPNDYSGEALARIYDFISSTMESLTLAKSDLDEVRARVGERGDLRPDLYEIIFTESFDEASSRGVRRSHVESAMRYPHQAEHLYPKQYLSSREKVDFFSFYVKHFDVSDGFSLLIMCSRDGYKQTVIDAWRVYYSDVSFSKQDKPSEVLRAFLKEFGYLVRVGREVDYLFIYKDVYHPIGRETKELVEIDDARAAKEGKMYLLVVSHEPGKLSQMFEVLLAFAYNSEKYNDALRRHGLKIKT